MKLPMKRTDRDVCSWDPFDEIRRMQQYMEQMMRTFPALESRFGTETLSPLTDVAEEGDKIIITTDLPGVDRENVELNLKDNVLVISAGQRKRRRDRKRRLSPKRAIFHALLP